MIELSKEEIGRYSRHLLIPEFNLAGQKKLKQAKVLVVGAGGLGCPLLLYLAAAGVGKIGIVDFDVVEISNLHRQTLFGEKDLGKLKVKAAKERLTDLNPHISIETYPFAINRDNAMELIANYDLVADGTDNFQTRYLVNDACVLLDKVNIYASIFRFDGQVSVFNWLDKKTGKRGPNYRDLYAAPPPPGLVPSCAEAGVLGVLPGIIGSLQASEAIKVIAEIGEPLSGRLFIFDALSFTSRILNVRPDPANPLNGENPRQFDLIDYDFFCGLGKENEEEEEFDEISVQEFEQWRTEGKKFQLVDVREPYEFDIVNLGGVLVPLNTIPGKLEIFSQNTPIILICRTGVRSKLAVRELRDAGLNNLLTLKGGILAYKKEINPELIEY